MLSTQKKPNDILYNLDYFFELSPDVMCIAGYDGYFRKVNPALITTLGYTEEELFAKPIYHFIHEDDRSITSKKRQSLLEENELTQFENRYIHKNGSVVWFHWSSIVLKKEDIIYAVAKDITLKKNIEIERNLLLKQLSESNKDLKHFNYSSSHDLRSPLSNLITLHQLIDESKIKDPDTLEYVKLLRISTENLNDVITSYLDGWIKKDRLNLKTKSIDFEKTLNTTQDSIKLLIEKNNVTIQYDFKSAPSVVFNLNFLKSIFLNLITNSIKYARLDLASVINIHSFKSGNNIKLVFQDNGSGIDLKSASDKVFKLHQRFHDYEDSKGIGLYLVHNHITSLGGNIEIESKLNEGTRFTLTFKS